MAAALVTLVMLPPIGLLLVTMADLVPDRPIMEELDAAVQAGRITPEFGPRSTSGRLLDTWTDCHTVTVGLGDAPDTSRWSAPLRSPTLGNCERAVERIEGWVDGEGLTRQVEYFRYWHGTAVVSRPGMATIGLVGNRIATGWILVGAMAGLGWSLARRDGVVVPIASLGPFALTTDFLDLPTSLHQAWAAIAAIVVAWIGHEATWSRPSPGRAVVVSIVAASRRLTGRSLAGIGGLAVGGWVVGYGWMWVTKWLFAIPVYGVDRVRDDIVDQTTFRLDGQPDDGIDLSSGAGLQRTWSVWSEHPLTWPVLVALVAVIVACRGCATSPRRSGLRGALA